MLFAIWLSAVCLLNGLNVQQDQDTEMQARRFRQSIQAYLSRSKARETLPRMLADQAEAMGLSDKTLEQLRAGHKDAISNYVRAQADIWAKKKLNKQIFMAQSSSLTKSTYMIETSDAWQAFLGGILTAEELANWNEIRNKNFEPDRQEFQQLQTQIDAQEKARKGRERQQAVATATALLVQAQPADQLRPHRAKLIEWGKALAEATSETTQAELEKEIRWLAETYDFADQQSRKLELAARGVARKRTRSALSRLASIESETPSDDVTADAQIEDILDIYAELVPREGLGKQLPDLPPLTPATRDAMWVKAVKSTLSEEQQANYLKELRDRDSFRRETQVRWIVFSIDKKVRLRSNQRERLLDVFSKYEGTLNVIESVPGRSLYDVLPGVLGEEVDLVLTPKQRKRLQSVGN